MVVVMITALVATTLVLAFTIDPEVRRCEYCEGPITLRELWSHVKKCRPCPGSKKEAS